MTKSKKPLGLTVPPRKRAAALKHLSLPLLHTEGVLAVRDLEKGRILGRGNGGIVYKAFHRKSYSYYALKVLCVPHDSSPIGIPRKIDSSPITREMDILRKTDCPYVVKCQGIFPQEENINFVLEYMDGGSLADLLKEKTGLPESFLANVALQVTEGLKYLHRQRIVHRDIKPSNILISKNRKRIKIADFGVSRFVSPTIDPFCTSSVGTYAYMSPERFDPQTYGRRYNGYAGDIWSLGLTLLECYLGHFPFVGAGEQPDLYAISVQDPPSAPSSASPEFQSFIRCCLEKHPSKRLTVSELLEHSFLARASQSQQPYSPSVSFHCLILAITSFDRLRILGRHRLSAHSLKTAFPS